MKIRTFKKRWHNIVTIFVAVLVAIILIGAIFVNNYWSPILSSALKKTVLKSSDSLYKVDFSSAEMHVLRGTIDINNITLKLDTAIYLERKRQNLAPNNLVELRIKRLTLSHIHPFKWYFLKKLDIGTIAVDQPILNVSYQLNHKKDTSLSNSQTVWQKISKSLKSIHIGDILLGDVKLKYEDYSGNKLAISEVKELNLSAHEFLIDSTTQNDKSRQLFCKDIVAELNNYKLKSPNGLYTFHFDHLRLSTQTSRLNIEGLTLKPAKTDEFFAKSTADKFSFRLDSLQLDNFDFVNYHKYRVITSSALSLKNGHLEVFGNPKFTQRATDRVITFPNAALTELGTDVKIDTINVKNIDVFYNEFNEKSHKTGTVSFYKTTGRFLNVTSRREALQKNHICNISLHTRFMNQGDFDLKFVFDLTDQDHAYSYSGTIGPMNLKAINPATMPLALLKIQNGNLTRMTFNVDADQYSAEGKMLFLYTDAKVTLLKYDSLFTTLQSKPIPTLYANNFILKRNNPDKAGETPREVYITDKRDSQTPFFKYTWETIRTGIKGSIGMDEQTQARTVALLNQMAADKQQRKLKRQQRKERRAERRLKRAEKKQENGGQTGLFPF